MKITNKKEIITDSIVSVVCNKSGKEIKIKEDDYPFELNLMHNFEVNFGFGSDFEDESWEFELYEDELLNFIRTFKHKPEGFCVNARCPDAVWNEWKKTGKINWKAGWTKEEIKEEKMSEEIRNRHIADAIKILGFKK